MSVDLERGAAPSLAPAPGRRRGRRDRDRLGQDDLGRDGALAALYSEREREQGPDGKRTAGLGGSAPAISRWLGDIRRYFPSFDGLDHAARRPRAAQPPPAADGARAARLVRAQRPPREPARLALGCDADGDPGHRPPGHPHGRRAARAADRREDALGHRRRHRPRRRDPPPARSRHRLGPHDPQEPAPLPARAQDGHPRDAARATAAGLDVAPGRDRGDRPVGLDGGVGRLQLGVRGGHGLDPRGQDAPRRLRHRGRRPHRGAPRPGRAPVRHPAGRRHRHQPRRRLLPDPDRSPDRHGVRADQRPVRGRRRGGAAQAASRRWSARA